MLVKVSVNDIKTQRALKKGLKQLSASKMKRIALATAKNAAKVLRKRVPQETELIKEGGYSGRLHKSIKVIKRKSGGSVKIENPRLAKIFEYLDKGTKAHGPTTKKKLYIPLSKKGARSRSWKKLKWGVDFVLAKKVKGIKAAHYSKTLHGEVRKDWADRVNKALKGLGKDGWRLFNWGKALK